jgi:S-methylmethionine-dependent homocysteine/selenocysteine methylase
MRLEVDAGGIVLDGAMGTLLEDEGVDVKNALWGSRALLDPPGRALTTELHRRYVAAGAELLMANTHNASLAYCQRFLDETPRAAWPAWAAEPEPARALMRALNRAGLSAARAAAEGTSARVAGCLASPDVPYTREATLSPDEVAAALGPQVDALTEGPLPDLLLFEMCTTASDLDGVAQVARGLDVPIGIGLVCGDDERLLGGVDVPEAVERLRPARPAALFVQCTRWDLVARPLEALLAAAPGVLVGAYGNDGRQWLDGAWAGERVTPETYADAVEAWWRLGARAIGGCCGTTPSHVAALRARVDALRDRSGRAS